MSTKGGVNKPLAINLARSVYIGTSKNAYMHRISVIFIIAAVQAI